MDKEEFKKNSQLIIKLVDLLDETPKFYSDRNSTNTNIEVLEKRMRKINPKKFKEYRRVKEKLGKFILTRIKEVVKYKRFPRAREEDVDLIIRPYMISYVWRYLFKFDSSKSSPSTFVHRVIGQALSKARKYAKTNKLTELLFSESHLENSSEEVVESNIPIERALERLVNLYSGKL